MGRREKQAYLKAIRNSYHKAKRADKGKILDEFCSVCGSGSAHETEKNVR
ncbi:MAG TPA: hypothetical protein VL380_09635 [Nitrosospira sp.]|jgi:hypothetical protein|nr:hypothetical protein [Nitrosospira sp.]